MRTFRLKTFMLFVFFVLSNLFCWAQTNPISLISSWTNLNNGKDIKVADFNGDGKQDLFILTSDGPTSFIYFAKADGSLDSINASQSILISPNAKVTIGDFNNDRKADIGAIEINNQGLMVLRIFHGSASFISFNANVEIVLSNIPDFRSQLVQIAPVSGDLNGDGFDDVAIGSPYSPATTPFSLDYGMLIFIYGSVNGLNSNHIQTMYFVEEGNIGYRISFAGDVNKDGFDDVIFTGLRPSFDANKVYLAFGSSSTVRLKSTQSYFLKGTDGDDNFGMLIGEAEDINGDGIDDVYVSDPNTSTYRQSVIDPDYKGRIIINKGDRALPLDNSNITWSRYPPEQNAEFGSSIGSIGDFDDDGFSDMAIVDKHSITSRLLIYRGRKFGLDSIPAFEFPLLNPVSIVIAKAGDVNGDGYKDFFICEPEVGAKRILHFRGRPAIVPDFQLENNSVCLGSSMKFIDKSFIDIPHTRLWDFGDGTTDTAKNPVHTFSQTGLKTITLTIIDGKGRRIVREKKDFITVRNPLTTGTYTVGAGSAIADIKALNDILECGITGKVTIKIKDGIYSQPLKLRNLYASDSLIIESESGDASKVIIKVNNESALSLINVRNVTFKNIRFEGSKDPIIFDPLVINDKPFAILKISESENIKFFNCNIFQAAYYNNSSFFQYLQVDSVKNLTIEGCNLDKRLDIDGAYSLIIIKNSEVVTINKTNLGYEIGPFQQNRIVIDSTKNVIIDKVSRFSFDIKNSQTVAVKNSKVDFFESTNIQFLEIYKNEFSIVEYDYRGYVGKSLNLSKISGFKLSHNVFRNSDRAFLMQNCNGITNGNWNIIANNIVLAKASKNDNNVGINNIYLDSLRNVKIYHNTFNLSSPDETIYGTTAIGIYHTDSLDFRNNLIKCPRQVFNIKATRFTADYNVYNGRTFLFNDYQWNYAPDLSLYPNNDDPKNTYLAFNTYSFIQKTLGTDYHSIYVPITFAVDSITPSVSSAIYLKKGAPRLLEVTDDINNLRRDSAFVDIGAAELNVQTGGYKDVAAIKVLTQKFTFGSNRIAFKIVNMRQYTLDSLIFYYQVNNGEIVKEKYFTKLNGLDSLYYNFATPYTFVRGARVFNLKCWVKLSEGEYPNFTIDNNDTVTMRFTTGMQGEYTIGGLNPDFSTIQQAIDEIQLSGTIGNILLNVNAGDYTAYITRNSPSSIEHRVVLRGIESDRNKVKLTVPRINYPNILIENMNLTAGSPGSIGGSFYASVHGTLLIGGDMTFRNCTFNTLSYGSEYIFGGLSISQTHKVEVDSCIFKGKRGIDFIRFDDYLISSYTDILDTVIIKNCVFEGSNECITRESNKGPEKYFLVQNNLFVAKESTVTYPRFFSLACQMKATVLNNVINDVATSLTVSDGLFANNVIYNSWVGLDGIWTVAHNTIYNGKFSGNYTKVASKQFNNCITDFNPDAYILLSEIDKNNIPAYFSDYNLYYRKTPTTNPYDYSCKGKSLNSFREFLDCLETEKHSIITEEPRFVSNTDLRPDTTQNTPLSNSGLMIENIPELAFDKQGRPRNLLRPDIGAYEVGGSNSTNIWAGDTDDNGVVDNEDLFRLGTAIPQNWKGSARTNPSIQWMAQASTDWGDKLLGIDAKHIDTNGNGHITTDDVEAINRNFAKLHINTRSQDFERAALNSVDIPIYFSGLPDSLNLTNDITGYINLGYVANPANDIYGIAYRFLIDTNRIVASSFKMTFDSCWIGTISLNLLSNVAKVNGRSSIEIGIVRTDGQNISGHGKIGKFTFRLKETTVNDLNISLQNILVTDKNNTISKLINNVDVSLPIQFPNLSLKYAPNSQESYSTKVMRSFNQRIGIRVTNTQTDIPLAGVKVSFSLPKNGASAMFSDSTIFRTVETNTEGIAQIDLGIANKMAGSYFLVAQVIGRTESIRFVLKNKPEDVFNLKITQGSNQKTNINTPFEKPLALAITDIYNNAIEGEYVNFFNYPLNNNSFSPNAIWIDSSTLNIRYIKTDNNGIARIYAKANQFDGTYSSVFASYKGFVVNYNLTNVDSLKTSIPKIEESSSWILFPNPSKGIITVKNNDLSETIQAYNVYDITGVVKSSLKNGNDKPITTIDLHCLENGYYIIELITERRKIYKKIILQR